MKNENFEIRGINVVFVEWVDKKNIELIFMCAKSKKLNQIGESDDDIHP